MPNFKCSLLGKETNFEKKPNFDTMGLPYDFESVMHYPGMAFSIDDKNKFTIKTKVEFES